MDDLEFFLSLDDLKGTAADSAKAQLESYKADKEANSAYELDVDNSPEIEAEDGPDFSFLDVDNPVFEDEDGWIDPEATEETEEVEETEEEVVEDEDEPVEGALTEDEEVEYEEGEAYDVDFDTIITLPDGRELSIEELSNGFMAGTDLTERETKFQEALTQFEERVSTMKDVLQLSELEADRVISDYQGFDWDKLAVEDPQAYVENKRFLERYQARKQELIDAQTRLRAEAQAKEDEAFRAKSVECVQILKQAIPNWNDALYETLLQYAIDNGADEEAVLKENRPDFFKVLYKAYQFDTGKAKVMAKIKRPGAPKKVVKPGTKPVVESDKRELAAQRYAKGQMSQEEAFAFLED